HATILTITNPMARRSGCDSVGWHAGALPCIAAVCSQPGLQPTCQPAPNNGTVAQAGSPFAPVPANCASRTPERFDFASRISLWLMDSISIFARQPRDVFFCLAYARV